MKSVFARRAQSRVLALPVGCLLAALPSLALAAPENPCDQLTAAGWRSAFMWRTQEMCNLRQALTEARPRVPDYASASPKPAQGFSPFPLPGPVNMAAPGDSYRADEGVYLRSGPGKDHGKIAEIQQDEDLIATGRRIGEWWEVVYISPRSGQATGWVFSQWVHRRGE
jgi:uncharacterized protein YgiM (DUF1202 family)